MGFKKLYFIGTGWGSNTLLRKWKLTVGSRNQAVRWGNDESWFCPRLEKQTVRFSKASTPALGPTQPPTQRVPTGDTLQG